MIEKVEIGLATLYNGECEAVSKLIESVDHTITDPPYEAEAHASERRVGRAGGGIKTDALNFDSLSEELRDMIATEIVRVTKKWALVFCQIEGWQKWRDLLVAKGATKDHPMVWQKPDSKPRFDGSGPGHSYEMIELVWCGTGKRSWNGGGTRGFFAEYAQEKRDEGNVHQTVKPQRLMSKLVTLFTNKEETIFDPFMGSGSTGVAAVSQGRRFIGIERNADYFKICCQRIDNAQKGDIINPTTYVKTKAQVVVPLFETAKAGRTVAPPKPRGEKVVKPVVAQKKKFSVPVIETDSTTAPKKQTYPWTNAFFELHRPAVEAAKGNVIKFDEWQWKEKRILGLDVESYRNFFLICFIDFKTGERFVFERSTRTDFDVKLVRDIIEKNRIISFNGMTYDIPMIYLALKGTSHFDLKQATNKIIEGRMMYWQVERELNIRIPTLDHIDLMEPNPAVKTGLKILGARLNGRFVVDLPYEPESTLSADEMNYTTFYCFNDIDETKRLFEALAEPLELRRNLSREYKMDLRSKSDAQVGEAIIKKRIGDTKKVPASAFFHYSIPNFIHFSSDQMKEIVSKLAGSEFSLNDFGKIEGPEWLKDCKVKFGDMTYNMGLGGLHSTEECRAVHSDDENDLEDMDVTGQYPNIIAKLGMYPKGTGKKFTEVFPAMIKERADAKKEWQRCDKELETNPSDELRQEREVWKTKTEGGKIANNGVYGKTGSSFSFLYAPDLMIATTITGQLSLLMLIEKLERAGIPVVSGNTDGVLARCPKDMCDELDAIVEEWETDTGFNVERAKYKSIFNASVNDYIAIKDNGKVKIKGPRANPWAEKDLRGMMTKNPQMTVITEALIQFIKKETPFEETIRACTDPKMFITINKVDVGAKWRGHKIGRAVRYYWSVDGDPLLYAQSGRKVAKTDGARPMIELTDKLPPDIDYDRYVKETEKIAAAMAITQKGRLI